TTTSSGTTAHTSHQKHPQGDDNDQRQDKGDKETSPCIGTFFPFGRDRCDIFRHILLGFPKFLVQDLRRAFSKYVLWSRSGGKTKCVVHRSDIFIFRVVL